MNDNCGDGETGADTYFILMVVEQAAFFDLLYFTLQVGNECLGFQKRIQLWRKEKFFLPHFPEEYYILKQITDFLSVVLRTRPALPVNFG